MTFDPGTSSRLCAAARAQADDFEKHGTGLGPVTLRAMADQLEAAQRTIDSGNETFRVVRAQWTAERDKLQAEVDRMRPVVEAALGSYGSQRGGGFGAPRPTMTMTDLADAIDAYRAARDKAGERP